MEPRLLIFIVLFAVVLGIGPIVGAILLAERHRRLRPECKPFGWGYYNALGAFVAPVFIAAKVAETDVSVARVIFIIAAGIYIPLGILTLRRNRLAFVLLTIVFLNPLFWIINTIYINNRWAEMAPTGSNGSRPTSLPPRRPQSRCSRCGAPVAPGFQRCERCAQLAGNQNPNRDAAHLTENG